MEKGYANASILAVGIMAVYILSVGPVAALARKGMISPAVMPLVADVYRPLELAYDHVPPVRSAFDWYIGLWLAR